MWCGLLLSQVTISTCHKHTVVHCRRCPNVPPSEECPEPGSELDSQKVCGSCPGDRSPCTLVVDVEYLSSQLLVMAGVVSGEDWGLMRRGRLCRGRNHGAYKRISLSDGTSHLDSGCTFWGGVPLQRHCPHFFLVGIFAFGTCLTLALPRFVHSEVAISPL